MTASLLLGIEIMKITDATSALAKALSTYRNYLCTETNPPN